MLAGAGYSKGYVEIGGDRLARQAHLVGVVYPPRIAGRAGRPDRASKNAGQLAQLLKGFGAAESPSAANYDRRVLQADAGGLLPDEANGPHPEAPGVEGGTHAGHLTRP